MAHQLTEEQTKYLKSILNYLELHEYFHPFDECIEIDTKSNGSYSFGIKETKKVIAQHLKTKSYNNMDKLFLNQLRGLYNFFIKELDV